MQVLVMGETFLAELDLEQICRNFQANEPDGKSWNVMDVIEVLKGWGMRLRSDGRWLCDMSNLELFRDDEIIDAWNLSSDPSDGRYID